MAVSANLYVNPNDPYSLVIDWLHTGSQKSGRRNSTMLILKPTSVTRTFQVGTQRSKRATTLLLSPRCLPSSFPEQRVWPSNSAGPTPRGDPNTQSPLSTAIRPRPSVQPQDQLCGGGPRLIGHRGAHGSHPSVRFPSLPRTSCASVLETVLFSPPRHLFPPPHLLLFGLGEACE